MQCMAGKRVPGFEYDKYSKASCNTKACFAIAAQVPRHQELVQLGGHIIQHISNPTKVVWGSKLTTKDHHD